MIDNFSNLIVGLKEQFRKNYPDVHINVILDEDEDYNFSIGNRELFYSDGFQLFLFNIKQKLWEKNVHNIYFILDNQKTSSIPESHLETDMVEVIC
jgi:hypothetical protein